MPTPGPRPRAVRGALAAGVVVTAVLAGCGGGEVEEPAAASSTTSSSASATSAPDLAAGLLPAEAFDPQATVVAVSLEQLRQGSALAGAAGELQVTPESCAAAVEGTQPQLDDFGDVVGQSATVGSSVTVEVLVRGGPTDGAAARLADAARTCPEAQVSSPRIGTATIAFQPLEVPDLGDGAAALQYTTTVTQPDGTQITVPALVGVVEDDDRLVMLVGFSSGGSADPAAFVDLLEQAYQVQADALG